MNLFFELDRLRASLESKGVDPRTVELIVSKASNEISNLVQKQGQEAIDQAVQVGAQKESADFINQLRLDTVDFGITTESGQLDFSEPPRPMLPYLLKNAKPIKDGSGVYKIIPVGKPGNKPLISKNIVDEQRRISVERMEAAKARARAVAPAGSQQFRTATSKQDFSKQWVQPAKDKDFTDTVKDINQNLRATLDDAIRDIITNYMELF